MTAYAPTERTTPSRKQARVSYDRAPVHALLDEALLGYLAFDDGSGAPVNLPMTFVRMDDALYLHAARRGRLARVATEAPAVAFAVSCLDALVLARSAMHHSMNYRSVLVLGQLQEVGDPALARAALDALIDKLVPGRMTDARPPSAAELEATAVLRLPLRELSYKARIGPPNDLRADLSLPCWAGLIPLHMQRGLPQASDDCEVQALPAYLSDRGAG